MSINKFALKKPSSSLNKRNNNSSSSSLDDHPEVSEKEIAIERGRSNLLKFAKKPINISDLAPTENAALPTQLQQPIKGQNNIRMCPHFFSPNGCHLGNFCQFQHAIVSTATLNQKNVNSVFTNREFQRQQKREGDGNDENNNNNLNAATRKGDNDDVSSVRTGSAGMGANNTANNNMQPRPPPSSAASGGVRPTGSRLKPSFVNNNETFDENETRKQNEKNQEFFHQPPSQHQQQQQQQNNANNEPVSAISCFRWFWRELAKDFCSSEQGLAWLPFEASIENVLEQSYLRYREEDDGVAAISICLNKYSVDFDKMQICNAVDGGSRRPVQRIKIESGFFWFACEPTAGQAAWKFPFDVSCVLEREYVSGNCTSFGIRIGPRAAGLINFDTMTMQVLPEVAALFSSVLDNGAGMTKKESQNKKLDYSDLLEKIKLEKREGGLKKQDLKRRRLNKNNGSDDENDDEEIIDGDDDDEDNNKSNKNRSPDARNPSKSKNRANNNNNNQGDDEDDEGIIGQDEIEILVEAPNDDEDNGDNSNTSNKKNASKNSSPRDKSGNRNSPGEDDPDFVLTKDEELDDDLLENLSRIKLAKAVLQLTQTMNSIYAAPKDAFASFLSTKNRKNNNTGNATGDKFNSSASASAAAAPRFLTLKLQRQPLVVSAACPPTDFFGISRLRERACFVADSGEVLFSGPEFGPDVFSRDELETSVLPCIRAAVLGAGNVLLHSQNNNNNANRNNNSKRSNQQRAASSNTSSSSSNTWKKQLLLLPPCSDGNCFIDKDAYGSQPHPQQAAPRSRTADPTFTSSISNNNNNPVTGKKTFASGVRDVISMKNAANSSNPNYLQRQASFAGSNVTFAGMGTSSASNPFGGNKLSSLADTAKHLLDKRSFTMNVQHMHNSSHPCSLAVASLANSNGNNNNTNNLSSSTPISPFTPTHYSGSSNNNNNNQNIHNNQPLSELNALSSLLIKNYQTQTTSHCFLHEVISVTNFSKDKSGKELQEIADENPDVAKQLKFISVSAQVRARLHEQFFNHNQQACSNCASSGSGVRNNNHYNYYQQQTANDREGFSFPDDNDETASSGGGKSPNAFGPRTSASIGAGGVNDPVVARWFGSQTYLKQFRHFMTQQHKEEERTLKEMFGDQNNNNNSRPGSSMDHHDNNKGQIKFSALTHHVSILTKDKENTNNNVSAAAAAAKEIKRKKTARVLEGSTDQSLLPIQLLSEGTEEWNSVIEWCANSNARYASSQARVNAETEKKILLQQQQQELSMAQQKAEEDEKKKLLQNKRRSPPSVVVVPVQLGAALELRSSSASSGGADDAPTTEVRRRSLSIERSTSNNQSQNENSQNPGGDSGGGAQAQLQQLQRQQLLALEQQHQCFINHRIRQETSAILGMMPRVRRIDRYDLCMRYKRCRNEIFSSWLRVNRPEALASGERLVFVPATPDQLTALMEPADLITAVAAGGSGVAAMTAGAPTKRVVFTSFESAVLAAAAANGLLTSLSDFKKTLKEQAEEYYNMNESSSSAAEGNHNNNKHTKQNESEIINQRRIRRQKRKEKLLQLHSPTSSNKRNSPPFPSSVSSANEAEDLDGAEIAELGTTTTLGIRRKRPAGIIVGVCYAGPTARAETCASRLFNYPSVRHEKDPLNPEFRCVMNTSAVIEGESNSFVALFLDALFCPLYFISLNS